MKRIRIKKFKHKPQKSYDIHVYESIEIFSI